jgi:protein-L-isoaspartate(D-aspartate) O-methyltransferase
VRRADFRRRKIRTEGCGSSEEEKVNLMYWQFTCEMFCTPQEWEWWFQLTGYTGDYSFIYFE